MSEECRFSRFGRGPLNAANPCEANTYFSDTGHRRLTTWWEAGLPSIFSRDAFLDGLGLVRRLGGLLVPRGAPRFRLFAIHLVARLALSRVAEGVLGLRRLLGRGTAGLLEGPPVLSCLGLARREIHGPRAFR